MNQNRLEILIKRAVFMLSIMVPILIVLEFTGNRTDTLTLVTGGILAAIAFVIYPEKPRDKKPKDTDKK